MVRIAMGDLAISHETFLYDCESLGLKSWKLKYGERLSGRCMSTAYGKQFVFSPPAAPACGGRSYWAAISEDIPGLHAIQKRLQDTKERLSQFDIQEWGRHTSLTNLMASVVFLAREDAKLEFCTTAWLKLYEILIEIPDVLTSALAAGSWSSLHLAEAPGAMITALNHAVCSRESATNFKSDWSWMANSLHPYHEGNETAGMVDDDRLMCYTRDLWLFGADGTGDVRNPDNIRHITATYRETLQMQTPSSTNSTPAPRRLCMLVTADGSINCENAPHRQAAATAPLQYCELVAAFHALDIGGSFILKLFTFEHHSSLDMLYLLRTHFRRLRVIKPAMSKPGNAEVYAVAVGFHGITEGALNTLTAFAQPSWPSGQAVHSFASMDPVFLEEAEACADLFSTCQAAVLTRNIRLFQQGLSAKRRRLLHHSKMDAARAYLRKLGLDTGQLPPGDPRRVVPHWNLTGARGAMIAPVAIPINSTVQLYSLKGVEGKRKRHEMGLDQLEDAPADDGVVPTIGDGPMHGADTIVWLEADDSMGCESVSRAKRSSTAELYGSLQDRMFQERVVQDMDEAMDAEAEEAVMGHDEQDYTDISISESMQPQVTGTTRTESLIPTTPLLVTAGGASDDPVQQHLAYLMTRAAPLAEVLHRTMFGPSSEAHSCASEAAYGTAGCSADPFWTNDCSHACWLERSSTLHIADGAPGSTAWARPSADWLTTGIVPRVIQHSSFADPLLIAAAVKLRKRCSPIVWRRHQAVRVAQWLKRLYFDAYPRMGAQPQAASSETTLPMPLIQLLELEQLLASRTTALDGGVGQAATASCPDNPTVRVGAAATAFQTWLHPALCERLCCKPSGHLALRPSSTTASTVGPAVQFDECIEGAASCAHATCSAGSDRTEMDSLATFNVLVLDAVFNDECKPVRAHCVAASRSCPESAEYAAHGLWEGVGTLHSYVRILAARQEAGGSSDGDNESTMNGDSDKEGGSHLGQHISEGSPEFDAALAAATRQQHLPSSPPSGTRSAASQLETDRMTSSTLGFGQMMVCVEVQAQLALVRAARVALTQQAAGGRSWVWVPDSMTRFHVGILWLLARFYKRFALIRPPSMQYVTQNAT